MKLSRGALALVAVGLALLAGAWWLGFARPSVGVEITSRSMSHADENLPGVLDPGERITLERVAHERDLHTYVTGKEAGHRVGDDWGDVIAFRARAGGQDARQGIVHRAMAWAVYNASADAYDVPELGLSAVRRFVFPEVGTWDPASGTYVHGAMEVLLDPDVNGRHDGFLTKGDHNGGFDQDVRGGLQGIGTPELVEVAHVNGKVIGFLEGHTSATLFWVAAGGATVLGLAFVLVRKRGARLLVRTGLCPSCGARMDAAATFCLACGRDR